MFQNVVQAVQDLSMLDRIADPVQPPLQQVFRNTSERGRLVKNFVSGTWIGHPLHPIVKDVPIGAWTMAAIFDLMSGESDAGLQRAADISIGTGLAGALASAVTGLADWCDTTGRPRRVGLVHALLNVSATAMYAASLAVRASDRGAGVRVGFCAYGTMLLGAYLGGHLVFGEQIGVNHAAQAELPNDYLPVMREEDLLDNQARRVDYKGLPVVLVRRASNVYALYERCSHMGGPLAKGTLEDDSIRCPWHGSRFALDDGRVLEGPATSPQPSFETRITDGQIFIRAREPESP